MVLRMPCPTKRPGSDNWYFRRTIPADVRVILATLPKAQRPRNWYKTHISISLRTADRNTAKAKCPDVAATVERQLAALREGPKPLTHKQIVALSGELYRVFAEGLEGNPVLSSKQWQRVIRDNEAARQGAFAAPASLLIGRTEADQRRASLQNRFGRMVDALMERRTIITDEKSRQRLIEQLSIDLSAAAQKLARNADGDYSPDEYAKRFPKFEETTAAASGRSLTALVQAWHKAALDRDMTERDAKRIKRRFEELVTFLKHDDAGRVTRQDIVRWRDHRRANKIAVKTINDSDIASFNNVFNWGVERGWLAQNPAAGTTIKQKRRSAELRDKFFTREECRDVLAHAASVRPSPKEDPKTTAAKRWVPWLCAYSGARVSEMIQLRKKDVRKDQQCGWVIRLTPEAGSIKTNKFCDVPVHEHLVAAGFIDFVTEAQGNYLFCNIGKDGTILGPADGVYRRVNSFVREVITDPNVQPLHAWRYTFKTYGLEAGIEEAVLDAISNHAPKHQGGKYTKVTLKARAEAMAKFPRYT